MGKRYGISIDNNNSKGSILIKLFPLWVYVFIKNRYAEITIGFWKMYISFHVGQEDLIFK